MKRQLALWKQVVIVAILCGAGYGAWDQRTRLAELTGISFGREASPTRRAAGGSNALPVIVEGLSMARAVEQVRALGDGRARRSITIYPEVSGTISEMEFAAGDSFRQGDVLLRLDDAEEKIAVAIAEAKRDDAQRTVERYETLISRSAVAQTTLDTARTALRTAELELEQAKEALADRTIRAPFDGVTGIPQVETGDRVSDTTGITSFDDRSVILVAFDVPEQQLPRIRIGQAVTTTTPGFRGRTFEGRITQINSRVDPQTRGVRVRAALANADDVLRNGMSFNVTLTLDAGEYPAVSELALLYDRDGGYVWSVREGKAVKVAVSVVKRTDGRVLVDGALSPGDLVIVEGTQRLRPGRPVSFEPPAGAAGKEAGL